MKHSTEHDTALSRGFDAGNYCNAYETEDLTVVHKRRYLRDKSEAYCHAFTLGFYASYEFSEIQSEHRQAYEEAYRSRHGQRVLELGFIDPQEDLS